MKLELIGHDEKYALEQSLLTLFPGEKPVYGTVDKTADTRWARVTLTEEDERVQVTTELGVDGKSAAHSYDYPLSGTEYEKEGQRRHAVGISFFGAAKDLLGISPAWGSLTGVRPSKVALSLIREGGKKRAEKELQELYCVTPARARLAIEAADAGIRAAAELEPNDISLYVGIPFCPTRCAYCSFVAQSVEKSFSLVEPYLEALFDEITAAGQLVRRCPKAVSALRSRTSTPRSSSSSALRSSVRASPMRSAFSSRASSASRADCSPSCRSALVSSSTWYCSHSWSRRPCSASARRAASSRRSACSRSYSDR